MCLLSSFTTFEVNYNCRYFKDVPVQISLFPRRLLLTIVKWNSESNPGYKATAFRSTKAHLLLLACFKLSLEYFATIVGVSKSDVTLLQAHWVTSQVFVPLVLIFHCLVYSSSILQSRSSAHPSSRQELLFFPLPV